MNFYIFFLANKHLKMIIAILMVATSLNSFAQSKTLRGKVADENEGAMPGVSVLIKGTSIGTVTGLDGSYSLNIPDNQTGAGSLVFSFVGYLKQEVPIGNQSIIDISMTPDTQVLEEIVVIGYGAVKKQDLTGAVSSIRADEANPLETVINVDQMLQGRVAGVQVTQSSAEPGGGVSINIRGASSINTNNEPLYVIDGLPVQNVAPVTGTGSGFSSSSPPSNPLNALNPNDIESIEILKDASATAIYGSRGANGVILITTKNGRGGKLQVDYNVSLGMQAVARKMDLLTTEEYIQAMNALEEARGNGALFTQENINSIGSGTDWQDVLFRSSPMQKHNLSFSGGEENTSFYVSLSYMDQEGVVVNSGFERYQGRVNLEYSEGDFTAGINLNTSLMQEDKVSNNSFSFNLGADAINATLNAPPVIEVRDEDGNFVRPYEGTLIAASVDNPLAQALGSNSETETNRTFGNIFARYEFVPGLSAKIGLSSDRQSARRDVFIDRRARTGLIEGGVATVITGDVETYLLESTVNYQKEFEKHRIDAVGGYTYQEFENKSVNTNISEFPSDLIGTNALQTGNNDKDNVFSNTTTRTLMSYLSRVNYSYDDTYLLTASIRADGSSNFGINNKFGYFPSLALAWRAGNEEFISNLGIFSSLKFRASWGQTGNDQIGIGLGLMTFAAGGVPPAILGQTEQTSLAPVRIPNPDLKWEATEQWNFGLDFGVMDERISASVNYFIKSTDDMLINLPLPKATGFDFITSNIGEVRNKGIEVGIQSNNLTGKLKWTSNFSFYTLQNEVISVGALSEIVSGAAGASAIVRPGDPLFAYYGLELEGIWQEGEDITNSAQPSAQPGYPKWKDQNGDKIINGDDRTILGDPYPDYTFGIGNTFSYKGFNLNFFIEGQQGVELFNYQMVDALFPNDPYRNRLADPVVNRWTPDNPTNKWPSAITPSAYADNEVNSMTVEDASFIRLKNVRLSYNIPIDKIDFINLRSASFYVSGQNLALLTNFSGFDPDVNSTGDNNIRAVRNPYPRARVFTVGVNLGL
jgi:TonB-linked SusC/RagA family outer membrane protein